MLSANKAMIQRECDRRNQFRRVKRAEVDHCTFLQNIQGDLLISGYIAADTSLLYDMVTGYLDRNDMPTVVLSGRRELFQLLRERPHTGSSDRLAIFDPLSRGYHPFYGMPAEKLLHYIQLTAQAQGYHTAIDRILQYAAAALNVVSASYAISLPALIELLRSDDDYISAYALQIGLSNVVADTIRGDHEAGIHLRRILQKLYAAFEDISCEDASTGFTLSSGLQRNQAVTALYCVSAEQEILNAYLKEDIFYTLRRVPKLRVILDGPETEDPESDVLLKYLFSMKRQGRIELVLVSANALEVADPLALNFTNVVLSAHDVPAITEALSKYIWGTYPCCIPVPVVAKPAALLFTLKTSVQWGIGTEDRLRVRADDLLPRQGLLGVSSDLLAIKTWANDNIYLVSADNFLAAGPGKGRLVSQNVYWRGA